MKKILYLILFFIFIALVWYILILRLDRYDYLSGESSSSPQSLVETDSALVATRNPFVFDLSLQSFYHNPFATSSEDNSFAGEAAKQKLSRLNYPLVDLNNCPDQGACASVCDEPINFVSCISLAEREALLPPKILEQSRVAATLTATSSGADSCDGSAREVSACAKKLKLANLLSDDNYTKIGQLIEALWTPENLPGRCSTLRSCRDYCASSENTRECLSFAVKQRWMSQEDADLLLVSPVPSR